MTQRALKPHHAAFLDAWFADPDRNATAAYMHAYPNSSERAARSASARLLGHHPAVVAEVQRREADLRERAALSAEEVLLEIKRIATADPRDLIELRVGACRYCHGMGHEYQRTPQEYRTALKAYQASPEGRRDPAGLFFDPLGGVGFNANHAPHPACPECFGNGARYEYAKDSRTLSPSAARLYAGLKTTKDGIQVLTRSQDAMVKLLAQTCGLLREKQDGPEGSDMPPAATVTYQAVDASKPT